jgi:hypothetical protein
VVIILVWWHAVQAPSTIALPGACGKPESWAWAANGTTANAAAAIKEAVED